MNSSDLRAEKLDRTKLSRFTTLQKLEYFKTVLIAHPRVSAALQELELMALPGSGTDIVLLLGPPGAGKSTLSIALKEHLLKKYREELVADPHFIPVVYLQALATGESKFSWGSFYTDLGELLEEPLLNKKLDHLIEDGRLTVVHVSGRSTVASLRKAVGRALKRRRTIAVLVDEGVHVIRSVVGSKLMSHMDALKSLANESSTTLVLVGSYDLFDLMSLSGQLARRSAVAHLGRYVMGVEKDERIFLNLCCSMAHYLPLENPPDLRPYASDLMRACVGCGGTLKDTLTRALAIALHQGGKWTESCLERAFLTEAQIATILEETLCGEANLKAAQGNLRPERKRAVPARKAA